MEISEKIKSLRKTTGLTQRELAETAGLSIATIQGYEQQKYKPKVETLRKIAHALGVPLSTFLEDELIDAISYPRNKYDEADFFSDRLLDILDDETQTQADFEKKLNELILQQEIIDNHYKDDAPVIKKYCILQYMDLLNSNGQDKAVEQVELLTRIPEFQNRN